MLDLAGVVLLVPQTAGIRGDLVGQQQRAVGGAAHFDLEVDQLDVDLGEDLDQGLVDLAGQRGDLGEILASAYVEGHQVIVVDERIVQIIVLQEVLKHRLLERQSFLHAQTGAEVAGGHVAQHDLQREHVHLAYQLAGVVHSLDEMAVDAALLEQVEDDGGDEVVQAALAGEVFLLFTIASGGGVLVFDPQNLWIVGCVQLLGLALVELFQLLHDSPFRSGISG